MKRSRFLACALALLAAPLGIAACDSDADKASKNLSIEAEKFKVLRKIDIINGITDKVEVEITGRCSYEYDGRKLDLVCREDTTKGLAGYKKHTVIMSDNLFAVSTQLQPIKVSVYRTTIVFKPENVIPNIDLVTGQPK